MNSSCYKSILSQIGYPIILEYIIFYCSELIQKVKKFLNEFLLEYLNNKEFQKIFENQYIVFINRKINGIYDNSNFNNTNSELDFDIDTDEIITVKINKNIEPLPLYYTGQTTIIGEKNNDENYKCFKVKH